MKLIYVAGKYSDKSDADVRENIELAKIAGHVLRALGFEPLVPHIAVLDPQGKNEEERWKVAMRSCLTMLERSDAVVLLPNWRYSRGARLERWFALKRGIPVFENLVELANTGRCDFRHTNA